MTTARQNRRSASSRPAEYSLKLSATQRAFVEDGHRYVLFVGGVGGGKSYAGAVRALTRLSTSDRPSLGLVVAPTFGMLRDATMRTALEVWAPLVQSIVASEMRVVLKNGHEVLFRSADDPDRLRGPNAAWAWIDEAAMCHPSTWPITIGRLRQHGTTGDAWLTTTPKGMNWVYQTFVVNATDETSLHRAATWANPFIEEAFAASLLGQYEGEFARQEIDAEFIADEAGTLLPWADLEAARLRPAHYRPGGPAVVAGIDVAGPGEAETVLAIVQDSAILDLQAWRGADPRADLAAALTPWLHKGLSVVNVDTAGIGHYLARWLADLGLKVRDVNVGAAPTSDEHRARFSNLKAEYYWALRDRFTAGDVKGLSDRTLFAQLAGLRYKHDLRGRVVIESKDEARARGVPSPDRAEALMLACCPPDITAGLADLYRRPLSMEIR